MRNLKISLLSLLALLAISFSSCSDDDDPIDPETESTTGYALWVITDPNDLSGLVTTSETLFSGVVDPTAGTYSLLGAARDAGISFDGAIYNPSNTAGDLGLQKWGYSNNTLTEEGFIANGESRFFIFELVSETKGYYTDSEISRTGVQIFNPTTMQRTGEIDLSEAMAPYMTGEVVSTKVGSFMIENDGYLYTQVFFYNSDGLHAFDQTFVAVIDTETDALVNLAVHDDYMWLGFERKNPNFIGVAENGDLYLACVVGNSTEQPHSRCLRIKAGETDFDSTWKLDCNTIIGEEGSYSLGGPAVYNGKLYIRMKESGMLADYSNMNEQDLYAYEVDIETLEATKIEAIPGSIASSAYSVSGPVIIDGLVYFVVSNADYQGYYSYDPTSGEVAEAFSITGGIPSQLIAIQ